MSGKPPVASAIVDRVTLHDQNGHMVTTTIAHLKASLSRILAGVRDGEEVLVTDRGTPVARIVPYRPGGAELDDLVRDGRLRRAGATLPPGFWTQERPDDPHGALLDALLSERETGR